jgi:hypothetical protein
MKGHFTNLPLLGYMVWMMTGDVKMMLLGGGEHAHCI